MPGLRFQKDFQQVRKLPFCYLCGQPFVGVDEVDGDHVPPKAVFNPRDRNPVLKLKTHKACNAAFCVDDKKVGQLVAIRRRESPRAARDLALRFAHYPELGVALENLNVDATVWRWIRGFHAALYKQPLLGNKFAVQTPFPRADKSDGLVRVRPIRQQNLLAIETIKRNRVSGTLDTLVANNAKLRYECVWCLADDQTNWFCIFALDVYDWKDLGSHSHEIPARGCVGIYQPETSSAPEGAALNRESCILVPNLDTLDPFAA